MPALLIRYWKLSIFTTGLLSISYGLQVAFPALRLPPRWWYVILLFSGQAGITAACRHLPKSYPPITHMLVAFFLRLGVFMLICRILWHYPASNFAVAILYTATCHLLFLAFDLYLVLDQPKPELVHR